MDYVKNEVKLRRELHQIPELGWGEFCTTAKILETIEPLGWKTYAGVEQVGLDAVMGRPEDFVEKSKQRALEEGVDPKLIERMHGYTGTIAELDTGKPGPVTGLRFDIDCVGVEETDLKDHLPNKENFRSRHAGVMHSCGHDGHTAVGLTMAQWIVDHKDQLCGKIKLIFQPAEEGVRGAHAIVENGWLDDADALLASHVAPTGKADDGDVTVGTWGSLATTKYDVAFTGRAAHAGGFPEQGKNALLAAASAALALHAIPRHGGGQSFINVGTLRAGSGRNVVPDYALMQLEVRGETTEINQFMMKRTEEICRGAAAMQGCACEMTVMGMAEGQHSDGPLIERMGRVIRRDLPNLTLSTEQNAKNWGSDDVSVMMNRVQAHGGQATYMRAMTDMAGAQHTVTFDFDEAVLGRSVAVFCAAAMDLMRGEA